MLPEEMTGLITPSNVTSVDAFGQLVSIKGLDESVRFASTMVLAALKAYIFHNTIIKYNTY
jgi:hypothetical protein